MIRIMLTVLAIVSLLLCASSVPAAEGPTTHLLYVAVPGIRNDLKFGGHGVLVFDIDQGHKFLRRIPSAGLGKDDKPLNVKGICANAATGRLFVSTLDSIECLDLRTEKPLWEKHYDQGCDRLAITPDGKKIFAPSFEKNFWHVIDATSGDSITRIPSEKNAHNTVVSLDGQEAYLADRGSRIVQIVNTATNEVVRKAGPFGNKVRPFTVNGNHTLGYMNVDELLGFEIADLKTGAILHRVEVQRVEAGKVAKHGCPCHGIGLTPDEKEIWLTDAHNKRLHLFDNTVSPPKQLQSLDLRDEPGWVTFSIDGKFAYPSTGEVIDVASRKIITTLKDEHGADVQSEKLVEIDFDQQGHVTTVGDQFGLGRKK